MKTFKNIEKLTQFNTPEESPGYLLWSVSLLWRSYIENTLQEFNLTHPQFVVLATTAWLTRKGTHINQIDISKAASLDPNTTSQIIRGLELKKLIKRTQSLNERSKNPSLTDSGYMILTKALPAVEKTDSQFFASISSDTMKILLQTLQKLQKI